MYCILSSLLKNKHNLSEYFFNLKKWDTALLLSSLGVPVNDMCLIRKGTPVEEAFFAVKTFFQLNNLKENNKVLIRAERENSLCETQIKGIQLNFTDAFDLTLKLLNEDYNVIMVKSPGERLSYNKSFIILIDKHGNFIVELLGKGFDATDLTKGRIGPEIVIRNKWGYNIIELALAKKLSLKEISVEYINSRNFLCNQRVDFILSSMADDLPQVQSKEELMKIHPCLFDYNKTDVSLKFIQKILEYGFNVYNHFVEMGKIFDSLELIGIENNIGQNVFFNIFYK